MAGLGGEGEKRRQPPWHFPSSPPVPTSFPLGHILSIPPSTAVCSSVSLRLIPHLPHIPAPPLRSPVALGAVAPSLQFCSPGRGPATMHGRRGGYASGMGVSARTLLCSLLPHLQFRRVLTVSDPASVRGMSSQCCADSTIPDRRL